MEHRGKGELGQLQIGAPRVEPGQGEQVLHDVGHAVALVEDDSQELLLHGWGQVSGAVHQRFGIAADVGEGGAQLVGHVGHELPAHLLVLPLLGDVVDDHQYAPLPVPVEGSHQQLEESLLNRLLFLEVVGHRQHPLQRDQAAEQLPEGGVRPDGPVEHLLRGGIEVDDLSSPGEGHHAVRHVEKEGVELVALVLHLADGVLELTRHIVEGVGEHADLVPGGHLDLMGEVPLCHPHGSLRQPLDGGDHGLGEEEGQQH